MFYNNVCFETNFAYNGSCISSRADTEFIKCVRIEPDV